MVRLSYFSMCATFAYYQTWQVFELYFQYPFYTLLIVDRPDDFVIPAMTVCTPISVKKSSLSQVNEVDNGFNDEPSRQLQQTMERYYRKFLRTLPLEDIIRYAPNFQEFVVNVKCLPDKIFGSRYCDDLRKYALVSLHEVEACWTLFHRLIANPLIDGANRRLDELLINTRILINSETVLAGPHDMDFETGELVRFTIDLMKNESTSLHLPVTGTVRFHDSDRIASRETDVSLLIVANSHYRVTVLERKYHMLPPPYQTKCHHYYEGNEKNVNVYDERYIRSHFDCINNCLALKTSNLCSCWPPEVPFVTFKASNVTMCDWVQMALANQSMDMSPANATSYLLRESFFIEKLADAVFNNCTGVHVRPCERSCPSQCVHSFYDIKSETNQWPSSGALEYVNSSSVNDSALISLIRDDYVMYLEYTPIYDFISTVCSAGGIFALWIGFTFATLLLQIRDAILFSCNIFKRCATFAK